jgi:hypothetical protein
MITGFETGSGVSLEQIEFNPDRIIKRLEFHAS